MNKNNNVKTFVFVGGGLWLLYYIFNKYYNLGKKISVVPTNISANLNDLLNPKFNIELTVINPTIYPAKVTHVEGKLIYKRQVIGTVLNTDTTIVQPNNNSKLNIDVTIDFIQVLQDLLLNINDKSYTINFNGYATIDGFNLPINNNVILGNDTGVQTP